MMKDQQAAFNKTWVALGELDAATPAVSYFLQQAEKMLRSFADVNELVVP